MVVVLLYLMMALATCGSEGVLPSEGTSAPSTAPNPHAPTYTSVLPTTDALGEEMVYVPGGEFVMGSDDDMEEEKPSHQVYLDDFWIDRTEVTFGLYVRFLNDLGGHIRTCEGHDCMEPGEDDKDSRILYQGGQYAVEAGFEAYPMVEVSWYGARAYCAWAGKRLPTEAEWEKAARGTDARRYPWGNDEPECHHSNFDNCVRKTIEVGSLPAGASPYGALDMAGNVWEWTEDWYDRDYYKTAKASEPNPTGPASGRYKVARGASCYDLDELNIRSSFRFGYVPGMGHRYFGFRCVRE
jgi:formylglycine-generating enzyme required for sulfatase activity